MSFVLRRYWFAILLLLTAVSAARAATEFIQHVKLENASINEVADLLHKKYGWNVVLTDEKNEFYRQPAVTLEFTGVPVWVLVKYVCLTTGLKYCFDDDMVLIGHKVEPRCEYYPSDYKPKSKLDAIPYGTSMFIGVINYLPINYLPPRTVVSGNTVICTPPMPIFQRFETGVALDTREPLPRKAPQSKPAAREAEALSEFGGSHYPPLLGKLHDLKINLDLEQVSLREAIGAIRRLTIAADPEKNGINFYLKPFPGMNDLRVDMVLNKVSAYRALQYICASSGLEFHVEPYVVVIYRPQTPRKPDKPR